MAVVEGGTVFHIRADNINRPVFATNASGAKVWSANYLPFGGVVTSTGTPISLRFPGQWFELESNLHQNWMRDYDPTTGRYLQADPLGLVDGAAIYGYARGNPGRFIDPTGELGIVGALIGGAGNLGIQILLNLTYGEMGFWQATRCVNWSSVANAAAFGAAGGLPIGMVGKGILSGSGSGIAKGVGVGALSTYVAISLPKITADDECECKFGDAPAWVNTVKTFF